MKIMSFHEAIQFYNILEKYIPKMSYNEEEINLIEFLDHLINRIKSSDCPEDYLKLVSLVSGNSMEDFQYLDGIEVLNIFIDGLVRNRIFELINFFMVLYDPPTRSIK